jgi:hypothetical protein
LKKSKSSRRYPRAILQILMTATTALFAGCGGYGGGGSTNPVTVQVSPATATVQTGQTQQFTASVAYATNTNVTWEVNGVAGGNATVGTISVAGLYTAPSTVPNPAGITVTAISAADTTKSASATVSLVASAAISVIVAPKTVSVVTSLTQQFTASVANTSNTTVTWQVNGTAGGNATVGTISTTGLYTAPATVPSGSVSVKAISAADNTKSDTATVTVTPASVIVVTLSPKTPSVQAGFKQQFTATVANTSNTAVTWQVNGVTGGNATVVTINASGLYSAPTTVPTTNPVTVKAISQADSTKFDTATVTVTPPVSVTVSPKTATVITGLTQQFAATVTNTSNTAVTWQVNNVTGGNNTVGTISATGLYTAPAAVPSGTITVKAISQADSTRSDTATVTVVLPVSVTVSPKTPSVQVGLTQQFTATVANTSNTAVTWQVNNVTGGNSTVGTISAAGLYTAPAAAPSPATVTVKAISAADNTKSDTATVTVTPAPVIVVTVSPTTASVQVNVTQQFTATVANTSNKAVTWQVNGVTGGDSTHGTINASGLFTAPATVPSPATVTVTATSQADNTKSGSSVVTITAAGPVTVAISPLRAAITTGQTQAFAASVNGSPSTSVTWEIDTIPAGNGTVGTITAGGVYTPPPTGGVHNVVARSTVSITSASPASTVAVTDLAGVFTYHNDNARDGVNAQEYGLTTTSVKPATFGKLFSCKLDGAVYAQPLWVANVTVSGVKHNLLIAASTHDTVYAFDTDGTACSTIWSKSLLGSGETWVSSNDVSCDDLVPDIGIVGTPVIDPLSNTIYAVTKSKNGSNTIVQRIHALDVVTGAEKFGGPTAIAGSVNSLSFNPQINNQRAGLALAGGKVYIAWASHCDIGPYQGWVFSYNASDLTVTPAIFNPAPHAPTSIESGIWMAGGAPAVDASNNLFLITGNGTFDANSATAPNDDYGDSILKLSTSGGISVSDFFTPSDFLSLQSGDTDLGSGGATVLLDPSSGPNPHLMIGGGKEGILYLLNRDGMGHTGDSGAVQRLSVPGAIFSTPALWNNRLYVGAAYTSFRLFMFNTSGPQNGMFNSSSASQSSEDYGFPGTTPSVSARPDNTNGIVWALSNNAYCTSQAPSCGPAILRAYDALNLGTELWHSDANAADTAGNAVKFTVPTVANGKVYVGTRGNNTGGAANTTSTPGEIDVYGLKPN